MRRIIGLPAFFLLGCSGSVSDRPHVRSVGAVSDTFQLTHSLDDVAKGRVYARELESDLELSHPDTGFAHIADVASIGHGFAILDRRERQINVYNADGEFVRRFGREGDGPGEYRHPLAIAGNDSLLVVWNNGSAARLTVLNAHGDVLATLSARIEGDWTRTSFREPKLENDDFQSGPEDVTRRLAWWNDSTVAMFLQSYDIAAPATEPEWAGILGFSIESEQVDTLLTLPAHPMKPDAQSPITVRMQAIIPMFGGRSLWARGAGWVSYAHGDSTSVTVDFDPPQEGRTVIRWPAANAAVTHDDLMAFALHSLEAALQESADDERTWASFSRAVRKGHLERYIEGVRHKFADEHAEVQAMWGVGTCLFLSGSNPAEYIDGTSHSLLVWDLRGDTVADVVHLAATGARIRHVDANGVYTTFRDDSGVWHVKRFSHGLNGTCRGTRQGGSVAQQKEER